MFKLSINLPTFYKNKSSVFIKTLMSFILVFTIPLLIIGIISYLWTFDIVKTQTEQTYLNAVHDVRKNVDTKMSSLNDLSINISELVWVQKLMYMRGNAVDYISVDPFSINYNIKDLNTFRGINGFTSDVAIYFNEKDLVISSLGKHTLPAFFEEAFYYDGITTEYWSELLSKYNVSTLKNPETVLTYKQPRRLISFIQSLPVGSKEFMATFIAFVDEKTLNESLNANTLTKNGGIYVFDSNSNSFITGINCNDDIRSLIINKNLLSDSGSEQVYNIKAKNGEVYIVFRSDSTVNNWSYVAAIPLSVAMQKVNNIKLLTLFISLLSLVTGFSISYFMALKNYTPLANIIQSISPKLLSSNGNQKELNEYNFLQKALHSILESEDRTKEEIEIYKPLARNSMFIQLLRGNLNSESKLFKILDITFSNSCFTCLSIILDSEIPISRELQSDIEIELSRQKAAAFFVEVGGKNKVIILNTAYEQLVEQIIDPVLTVFKNSSVNYKAIGVGKTYKDIEKLCISYNEANTALDYRFIRGDNSIILYTEIEATFTLPSYYYHTDKEDHLVNYISCGNYKDAIKLFNEIIDKNINNSVLPPEVARNLCYNMAAYALKALEGLNIRVYPAIRLDDFFHMDTIHEMKNYIEELYRHVCDIITDEKESKNTQLRDDILSYINDNLTDSNLTLTSLADKFGASLAYFSRFIKDQTGTNFVDYLNKRRIDLARSLLKSDLTIRQVSHQVGFDNDLTFRRLFKKYTGINPGEYKNMDSSIKK